VSPRVVVGSGHMVDAPERQTPRFPAACEAVVRRRIAAVLDRWMIGPGDLALTGGARGSDMLFAELALERGADVTLYLALPVPEFVDRSVELPDTNWRERFFTLLGQSRVLVPPEEVDGGHPLADPFARNNHRMIEAAKAAGAGSFSALLVWDRNAGDGPGGTADFAQLVRAAGASLVVVDSMCESNRLD
jgi:hypothetical protein